MLAAVGQQVSSRKSLQAIKEDAQADADEKGPKLSLFDLLCIGVGSTIGSGVFILTGDVLPMVGPAATLSWAIAGFVCLFSALSYIELSMRIPTSGSCYTFSYHALGELAGVVGAVCLTLEYGISGAGVARSWSALFANLTGGSEYLFLWYPGVDRSKTDADLYIDLPAALIMLASVAICSSGLSIGKVVVNGFTIMKVMLVTFLIICGFCAWRINIFESTEVFFPHGAKGVIRGASSLFFGFIGFDEVCCLAGRAERPAYTMPRALAGTLAAAASISMTAQFALTVMAPATSATQWPQVFDALGWEWARLIANIGEVLVLPLVVLLSFLPQPELLGSMAKDGLIPQLFGRTDASGTYVLGSLVSGGLMTLISAFVPFSVLWDVISLGVLLSFNLTNTSLIMVRYGNGGEVRAPKLMYLVAGLWAASAVGSYTFWQGFASPALEGKAWESWVLVASAAFLLSAFALMVVISREPQTEDCPVGSFCVPAMPFIPGVALILNFILMATISWLDHLYMFCFLVLCIVVYFAYSGHRAAGVEKKGRKEVDQRQESVDV